MIKMNQFRILPIVVLYKTSLLESPTISSILTNRDISEFVNEIFVYDNSPGKQELPDTLNGPTKIHYVSDPKNPGVSKAYNEGSRWGRDQGYEWVQFFDQDTRLPSDFFRKLSEAIQMYPERQLFAPVLMAGPTIFSPYQFFLKRGTPLSSYETGLNSLRKRGVVNSGMCLRLRDFFACGGYNEKIALDFSDFYFIEQFKRRVSEELVVFDAICFHSISVKENITLESSYSRYRYYVSGSAEYETLFDDRLDRYLIRLNLIYWTFRLSIRFRSFLFFRQLSGAKKADSDLILQDKEADHATINDNRK